MTGSQSALERRCRLLLRVYPASWRRHHGDAMVAVLLDHADATNRSTVSLPVAVDLMGQGMEERLEVMLRRLPARLRGQVAVTALVVAAGLSLVMLVGELVGAYYRPTVAEIGHAGPYLVSGPVLSIGVGLYLGFLNAALLVVLGYGGVGRLLIGLALAYTVWMWWLGGPAGYPTPRLLVLALFTGLGLLGALATLRPNRAGCRRIVGYGAGFLLAVAAGLGLSKPVLGWSIGTMATSGNVAFAALATVLPVVGVLAILTAALVSRRHPGWPSAIAVAAFPVVLFCTIASVMVNRYQAADRAFYPVYYLLAVAAVAVIDHHGRRRPITG